MRSVLAGDPPIVPTLKVEVGMHTAMIRRMAIDEAHGRVVTAGDDKTIRVWDLAAGQLVRTVHLPQGPGHEGRGYALALSPDGQSAAVGGWTGWDWDGQTSIYLVNLQIGQFSGRIPGLPEIICYLTYSRSGEFLAVGLCRDRGLRVYRTRDLTLAFSDTSFTERIAGIDFDTDGRLAVTSYGADVRVYSPKFELQTHVNLTDGTQPTMVRFSPNGRRLAIGYLDTPTITIANTEQLSFRTRLSPSNRPQQRNLPGIAWSTDGRFVYAIGDGGSADNAILRWDADRPSAETVFAGGHGRLTALETTSDGGLVYAAEDPVWGRLTVDGHPVFEQRPPIHNFTALCGLLGIADELGVRWPTSNTGGPRAVRFAPDDNYYGIEKRVSSSTQYLPSPTGSTRLATSNWKDGTEPVLNGHALKLDPYEISRCVAVDASHQVVLMGSEWTLRLFNQNAELVWAVPLSQVAWTVGFTPNGRFAVAALSDGTIRWYRAGDGVEVVAAFLHADARNWIAWTPDGYYSSSLEGDNFMGWHVNQGRDRPADFFRAVQFDRLLYRPDAVPSAYAEANPRPRVLSESKFSPSGLRELLPPVIDVAGVDNQSGSGRTFVEVHAARRGNPMLRLQVFVNGIPSVRVTDQAIDNGDNNIFERRVEVPLTSGRNDIRVEIATEAAIGLGEMQISGATVGRNGLSDLYAVAIGADDFDDAKLQRLHAADDAHAVVQLVRTLEGSSYRQVHALEVSDWTTRPTRDRVLEALKFFENIGPDDTALLFLASHGISDAGGNYFFVPSDGIYEDARRVLSNIVGGEKLNTDEVGMPKALAPGASLVRWSVFFDAMRRLPGRRIVVVDTCRSGNFGGTFDVTSLAKRSFTSRFALVAASKGYETSQEYPRSGHGLFTYGLLRSWGSAAPADRGHDVTLDDIFRGAAGFVARNADLRVGTQTPQLIAPDPLGQTILRRKQLKRGANP